jgi:hypothetical protein
LNSVPDHDDREPGPCDFFKTLAVPILMSFSVLGGATWPATATELEVFTSDNLPWIASDAIGLRYTGEIDGTLAGQISAALHGKERHFDHVVFELPCARPSKSCGRFAIPQSSRQES